jgi:hypothetical protein
VTSPVPTFGLDLAHCDRNGCAFDQECALEAVQLTGRYEAFPGDAAG